MKDPGESGGVPPDTPTERFASRGQSRRGCGFFISNEFPVRSSSSCYRHPPAHAEKRPMSESGRPARPMRLQGVMALLAKPGGDTRLSSPPWSVPGDWSLHPEPAPTLMMRGLHVPHRHLHARDRIACPGKGACRNRETCQEARAGRGSRMDEKGEAGGVPGSRSLDAGSLQFLTRCRLFPLVAARCMVSAIWRWEC